VGRKPDLLIKNAQQLITPSRSNTGTSDLVVIENGAVALREGKILTSGNTQKVLKEIEIGPETQVIDASGKVVSPGFVDPHTHPIFYGTREEEFQLRLMGKSYQEVAQAGGGIRASVRSLRKASKEQLIEAVLPRLDRFLEHGTTTIEAKSGYGLSVEDEIKSLEVIRELNKLHPIDLVPTFLGAHEVPDEYRNRKEYYIELVIKEMLPRVAEENLAEFCDVFCEEGVFDINESRRILTAAKELGLKLKIHGDQLTPSGGAELAAELGAVSADHLDYITEKGMELMAQEGVVAVLLPGSVFFLGLERYAPAREMIGKGVSVALATDFNPGTAMTESMPIILTLACIKLKLTPAEALVASTLNAASAIDREDSLGSIGPGKQADLVIWEVPNYKHLPYHFGVNLAEMVIKRGKVVWQRK